MKPDQLPVVANQAVQNKLAQAQREVMMLQTSSMQTSTMMTSSSSTSFQRMHESVNSYSQAFRDDCKFVSSYDESQASSFNHSEVHLNGIHNNHQETSSSVSESIEKILLQGTETVRALTDALHRDELPLNSTKDDKTQSVRNGMSPNENKKASAGPSTPVRERKQISRERSVGSAVQSHSATPERESRRTSFSYLSLLPQDGSFPHRTQPLGGPQTSRKSSVNHSRASSSERNERGSSEKPNLMVRTNPIGLPEPSIKRDGHAVGKDGSFYRSSENLFSNPPTRSVSRAGSETPTSHNTSRRSSDTGIRLGGGLVSTGKSTVQHFSMPFGSTTSNAAKPKSYSIKRGSSTSSSFSKKLEKKLLTTSSETNTEVSTKIVTSSTSTKISDESTIVNCTVNLNRGRHRSQSSTRSTVTTLPDRNVTISLPGSLRASVDRDIIIPDSQLQKSRRSSSVEIFNGVYEVKVPISNTSSKKSHVEEIYTDHIIMRSPNKNTMAVATVAVEEENPHAEIILTGIPLNKSSKKSKVAVAKMSVSNQPTQYDETISTASQEQKSSVTSIVQNSVSSSTLLTQKTSIFSSATEVKKSIQTSSSKVSAEESIIAPSFPKIHLTNGHVSISDITDEYNNNNSSIKRSSSTNSSDIKELPKSIQMNGNVKSDQRRSIHSSRETLISGQKFNISTSLNKTSRYSSREDIRENGNSVVGGHLKGLDLALEELSKKQKNSPQVKHVNGDGEVTSVTVSLPGSRRTSRRGSVDLSATQGPRTRRNSLDLFSAEYDVKLASNRSGMATPVSLEQKTVCHVRIEDSQNTSLKLCPRCHALTHTVDQCTEFGDMSCPRCLAWNHWEDSCPHLHDTCLKCNLKGHLEAIHSANDFKQRRAIVDTIGWEPVKDWFFEPDFRSWWQLNSCIGVPLYKLYPRKSRWRTEGPILDDDFVARMNESNASTLSSRFSTSISPSSSTTVPLEERAAVLAEKYSSTYKVKRDSSVDDLLKSINEAKLKRKALAEAAAAAAAAAQSNDDDDSRSSTPDYLKKYSVNYHFSNKNKSNEKSTESVNEISVENGIRSPQHNGSTKSRLRTFSETLHMLDDDILADLDMK